MALFGALAEIRSQLANAAAFADAFDCVATCRRPDSEMRRRLDALPVGESNRVELGGGAFAILQAYRTKDRLLGRWETHRRYVDVQAVVSGEEFMELADQSALEIEDDRTPAEDAIFYRPFDRGSRLRLDAGPVAVYFPPDAHLGGIQITDSVVVRKVVVKVPVPSRV